LCVSKTCPRRIGFSVFNNMSRTNGYLKHTLMSGAVTTAATTAVLGVLGALKDKDPAGPINAVSHILFGDDDAMGAKGVDAKHTLTGSVLNAASVTMWAGLHELLFGKFARKGPAQAVLSGAVVSGIAYAVDYHVVPKRLTPGFEKKVSKGGLFTTYAVLALSFAAGALLDKGKESEPAKQRPLAPPISS